MPGKKTKKQQIIETSILLFKSSANISKISIEDIAREAGVSPTTIYNNFKDKDSLVAEVIKEIGLRNFKLYKSIIESDRAFLQKIQLIMKEKIKSFSELDFDSINKLAYSNKELIKFVEELSNKEIIPMLQKFINDGKKQGYIEPELSQKAILLYLDIITEGSRILTTDRNSQKKDKKILSDLNKIWFYGFVKQKK